MPNETSYFESPAHTALRIAADPHPAMVVLETYCSDPECAPSRQCERCVLAHEECVAAAAAAEREVTP